MAELSIGLIGDYDEAKPAHVAIPQALALSAQALGCTVGATWLPTPLLEAATATQLAGYDGLWCVPGSPYASMEGALRAIQYARESGRPFLGTCGGCQHALLEYARHVLGYRQADHAESSPETEFPLIAPLACALVETTAGIWLRPGSRVVEIYGQEEIVEAYHCSYGFNNDYLSLFDQGKLRIAGTDAAGEVRVVELDSHPFFVATLFQPERSALGGRVHPLITAYVRAALDGK
ncbi:MAG: CTP synthase [Chloroflexi bacterium]|nr:CTP synthase [Chloroflexota bacterium]MCI0577574.1 CTP synthase [Chloroflexota bacterium]MCI0644206.1 CTP synthase [Chloroflexota bacterium]MCI0725211.1 CTP synthase [Chloroflexota bacterium]